MFRDCLNATHAEAVIVAMSDDARNLIATLNLKAVNPAARLVVALQREELRQTLLAGGVTYIASPNELSGRLVASAAFEPEVAQPMEDLMSGATGDYDMQQYQAGPLAGTVSDVRKKLAEIDGPLLIAIGKLEEGGRFKVLPHPKRDMRVEATDQIIVVASNEEAERLSRSTHGAGAVARALAASHLLSAPAHDPRTPIASTASSTRWSGSARRRPGRHDANLRLGARGAPVSPVADPAGGFRPRPEYFAGLGTDECQRRLRRKWLSTRERTPRLSSVAAPRSGSACNRSSRRSPRTSAASSPGPTTRSRPSPPGRKSIAPRWRFSPRGVGGAVPEPRRCARGRLGAASPPGPALRRRSRGNDQRRPPGWPSAFTSRARRP